MCIRDSNNTTFSYFASTFRQYLLSSSGPVMKYNRNIKHNETIKYLGERVGDVSVCVRMYVSFFMGRLMIVCLHLQIIFKKASKL